jgi:outer membrane protein, heavy metal efflux system
VRRAFVSGWLVVLAASAGAQQRESVTDLTMERAVGLAEQAHPELRAARALLEAAEGRIQQAGAFPNPEALVRIESAPIGDGTASRAEYLAGVSQSAPIGGRLGAARRVQQAERERLARELEILSFAVRTRVRDAFVTVLYLGRTADVQADAVRIAENGARIAGARLAAGETVADELARAEMELVRARLDLRRAQAQRRQALVALAGAIGRPGLEIESIEGSLEAAFELPPLEALTETMADSPVVGAAEAQAAVQRAELALARAQRIPDLELDLLYRRIAESDEDAFDLGASIAVPLFDRGQGRMRAARAELAAAEARVEAARILLGQRLRETHSRLATALESAQALREELLPRADAALEAAESRYRAGDVSLTEVLPVRREWVAARLAYLEALREVFQTWAELAPYLKTSGSESVEREVP